MIKKISLTPKLRLGKLFKQGKINPIGNGSAEVQLAIVGNVNFPVNDSDWVWDWNYNENIQVGTSLTINRPVNSTKADFTTMPLDAFKLKVTMHVGGIVNIILKIGGKKVILKLTTEKVIANKDNIEKLAKTLLWETGPEILEDPTDPIYPETPEPEDVGFFEKIIKKCKDFIQKYKWYFIGGYITGVIILMITNSILGISLAFVMGIIAGILI